MMDRNEAEQLRPRVIIVERTPEKCAVYRSVLAGEDYDVTLLATPLETLAVLERREAEALVIDLQLTGLAGLDLLRRIHERALPVKVLVIVADHGTKGLAEAVKAGRFEYLVKPFSTDGLKAALRRVIDHPDPSQAPGREPQKTGNPGGFIGTSTAMQRVYQTLRLIAGSNATVFITGESGTGKEVAAEALHDLSPRRAMPFIAINCAAIPKDLIESELFGHVKGAFTGAVLDRVGAVRQAQGGTLFLDEIGELHLDLQAKLLRFLQSGAFQAVGSQKQEKGDVRIICATNRNPLEEVKAGRFRSDLYYRLHVLPLVMPPLRERDEDILAIAHAFLRRYAEEEGKTMQGFTREALALLLAYRWPGNVRELQNVIRGAVVMNHGPMITADMLDKGGAFLPMFADVFPRTAEPVREEAHPSTAASVPRTDPGQWQGEKDICPLDLIERAAIDRALTLCSDNVPKAAALLGINPSTIYRKRQGWGSAS